MEVAEGDWRSVAQNLTELLLNSVGSGEGRGRGRPGRKTTQGRRSNINGRALSQADCSYLAWSIIWVALHVRDAVLVDQVCLSEVQQRKVWKTLSTWQDISSSPEDTLFHDVCFLRHRPTGQLFIINRDHTSSRASALLQSEERNDVSPLLIAVDEAVRPGTKLDEVPPVLRLILEQLSTIHAASEHGSTPAILGLTTPSYAAVGLAGWLLGYPSIYLFANGDAPAMDGDIVIDSRVIHEEEDIAETAVEDEESWEEPLRNNLGGTQLCLFQASFLLPSSAPSVDQHIPLFAFTVPLAALQQSSNADSFETNIVDDLDRRRLKAMERLNRSIKAPSNSAAQERSSFLSLRCSGTSRASTTCVHIVKPDF
ncbi:hypothetical protein CF326_g514 [Tilletia indica]|nr:hypothetical protein CF326_g514 [Tilletia indica]